MSHARIEEVSDSDPEIDDPSEYLPDNDNAVIRTVETQQQQATSQTKPAPPRSQQQQSVDPNLYKPSAASQANYEKSREAIKHYCMLYPCYFSSHRTRQQGRRVSKDLAIPNPLAFNLLTALREVIEPDRNRIHIAFEPDKTHPKDWSNPGRVRIELFDKETHAPKHPTIHNKEHLYKEVAKYLKSHPTEKSDPLELKIQGLPVPEKFLDTVVPRPKGWETMNEVLPLHSAAVSGGGVKDDFFKEAMAELAQAQGQGGAGGADAGGMAGLQQMMSQMGGMGGMGALQGLMGGGAGAGGSAGGEASGGKKNKKDKKKG